MAGAVIARYEGRPVDGFQVGGESELEIILNNKLARFASLVSNCNSVAGWNKCYNRTITQGVEQSMAIKRKKETKHRRQLTTVDEVTIRLHIELLEEGGYVATSPDVPGLVAEGRSVMETVEIAQGLTRKIVESCLDHGDPIPPALANLNHTSLDLLVPVGIR